MQTQAREGGRAEVFSSSNLAGIFHLILARVSHFPESRSWTSPGEGFPALRGRETRVGFALDTSLASDPCPRASRGSFSCVSHGPCAQQHPQDYNGTPFHLEKQHSVEGRLGLSTGPHRRVLCVT